MTNCQNCARQYTCRTTGQNQCESFKSFINIKNYGEVRRVENTYDFKERGKKVHTR